MKTKIFLLFLACFLFCSGPAKADSISLVRVIEILKQEISLLQLLLSNMQSVSPVSAAAYLAVDLSNNDVLLEKNPNQTYSIASITKLMTSLIALENIDQEEEIVLTKDMLSPLGQSPSLFAGLKIKAGDLIKAALIQSSNDAAESLSYFLGQKKFIKLMNDKAKELDMISTIFYDVHGLNAANVSTVQDLVKLLFYIEKNQPEILNITKSNDFWLPDEDGVNLKFQNVNNFYPLTAFIGGKTGYLVEAKQTLASIFNVQGKQIALVLLYSANRQADVFTILKKLE
jgi:D-alanyl-D-alanine carboxypeptidase